MAQAPDLEGLDLVLKAMPEGPVARVNGVDISKDEFAGLYSQQIAMLEKSAQQKAPDYARLDAGLACLRMLVQRELIYQEAVRQKVELPEADLDQRWNTEMERMKQAFSSKSANKEPSEQEILEAAGATRDGARAELRKALLIEKMRANIADQQKLDVDEAEIKKFFDEHGSEFKRPDRIHLNQVFVTFKPTGKPEDETKKAEARKKIESALSRIHAGESFATVAKAVSEAPDKDRGGDLGSLPTEMLPPFFLEEANKLKPGEISGVIESQFGFHVIKLVESAAGGEVTYDQAKPRIRQMLLAEQSDKAVDKWCEEFMKNPGAVEIFLQIDRILVTHPELSEMAQKALGAAESPAPEKKKSGKK
jgi:peptidyl-prolyl cis-trans isomerase C